MYCFIIIIYIIIFIFLSLFSMFIVESWCFLPWQTLYIILVGFSRACAPVRCAHPPFWPLKHSQRGAARPPPIAAPLLLIYHPKLSLRPELGRQGRLSFHWAKLHPTELHCILLSYAAPSWAPLHSNELQCTLLWYAVHSKLCCI